MAISEGSPVAYRDARHHIVSGAGYSPAREKPRGFLDLLLFFPESDG